MSSTGVALVLNTPGQVDSAGGMASSLAVNSISKTARVVLTNAQLKALGSTPVQLIAAPSAGQAIAITQVSARLLVPTASAFTLGGGAQIQVLLNGLASSALVIMANAVVIAAANQTVVTPAAAVTYASGSDPTAKALMITTDTAGNPAGNAANDNTLVVNVTYTVHTL